MPELLWGAVGPKGSLGSVATLGAIPVHPQREIWIGVDPSFNAHPALGVLFSRCSLPGFVGFISQEFSPGTALPLPLPSIQQLQGHKGPAEFLVQHRLLWGAVPWNSRGMQSARTQPQQLKAEPRAGTLQLSLGALAGLGCDLPTVPMSQDTPDLVSVQQKGDSGALCEGRVVPATPEGNHPRPQPGALLLL